jgi:hypothetical protein
MAPPMGFYAPQPLAHADYVVASSPFYFSHLIEMQLTPDNYLSWRALLLPLLRSRYLEGYVDGSLPCPPPFHPAYHTWVAQDQAIFAAIQSSHTPSVSSMVLFATMSQDAWMALHTSFASQSQARAHAIHTELGETKLRDRSITDYFNKMTGLPDTLASIGQPLRSEDFTTYILNGLNEDYVISWRTSMVATLRYGLANSTRGSSVVNSASRCAMPLRVFPLPTPQHAVNLSHHRQVASRHPHLRRPHGPPCPPS